MIPDKTRIPQRRMEIDDKDYVDRLLDEEFAETSVDDDYGVASQGFWSDKWTLSDWIRGDRDE